MEIPQWVNDIVFSEVTTYVFVGIASFCVIFSMYWLLSSKE